ncbi:MAG TPA: hypothetical protein PLJ77_00345, partial [Dokdonella sp.]|nr:hypothetical protein [Dokdonella sp.]HQX66545.1 hypothetical protein [Dokdonella sp.]HQY55045.1 hypothetical protein [Dokdonella sp.]
MLLTTSRDHRRRAIAAAIALILSTPGWVSAQSPTCPIGTLVCKKPALDWSLCPKNDLLDFHVA